MGQSSKYIKDTMGKYHPFAVDYRNNINELYKIFTDFNPVKADEIIKHFSSHKWNGERDVLVDSISSYAKKFDGCHEEVFKNLDTLRKPDTFAIVCGHQPALLGGPLFLVLKIISVIRVCEILNSMQDNIFFVPVFWNGSEDHNFAEFGRVTLFDNEHDLVHLNAEVDPDGKMACRIDSSVADNILNNLEEFLPDTEFTQPLLSHLKECRKDTLSKSATKLFLEWFGKYGLIILEPECIRKMAVPFIRKALCDHGKINSLISAGTEKMKEKGYPAPLPVDDSERSLCYYINEEGKRERIIVSDESGNCYLEESGRKFSSDEIVSECESYPEKFSPSAALRPIIQCGALPVAVYVAGGGELSYHFQIKDMFGYFDVAVPGMLPRPAVTVLKKSVLKKLDKFNISIDRVLSSDWDWDTIKEKLLINGNNRETAFETFVNGISDKFADLSSALKSSGISNLNSLEEEKHRFLGRIEGLKKRVESQDAVVGDGARKQFYKVRKFVFPTESYQELSIWTIYFLALYGECFLNKLYENIEPFIMDHMIFLAE